MVRCVLTRHGLPTYHDSSDFATPKAASSHLRVNRTQANCDTLVNIVCTRTLSIRSHRFRIVHVFDCNDRASRRIARRVVTCLQTCCSQLASSWWSWTSYSYRRGRRAAYTSS